MLDRQADNKRLPSVARAAAAPSAIVLAGAGVAIGVAAHLGVAVAVLLGVVGYGARLAWAFFRRRAVLRERAARRLHRIDPWSVPDPWRGYAARVLDARKRYHQLASDCPPGVLADYLAGAVPKVDGAVDEAWALARSGASVPGPPGAELSARLAELSTRLEGVVASSGRLVAGAGAGTELSSLSSGLESMSQALDEARAVTPDKPDK